MSSFDASWLKFWEIFATIGFILVIVGVVMEGPDAFAHPDNHRWRKLATFGWLILVLGLAMEFLGEHKAKRIADRENVRLTKEAADARKQAGVAMKEAEELRASNLIQAQVNARLAKAAIGRKITPEIKETLRKLTPGSVQILHVKDEEAQQFAAQLQEALRSCGWKIDAPMRPMESNEVDWSPLIGGSITTSRTDGSGILGNSPRVSALEAIIGVRAGQYGTPTLPSNSFILKIGSNAPALWDWDRQSAKPANPL